MKSDKIKVGTKKNKGRLLNTLLKNNDIRVLIQHQKYQLSFVASNAL